MLFPRNTNHDLQSIPLCNIQQPSRRNRVRADGINTVFRHTGKILFNHFAFGKQLLCFIRTKSTVSYTSNIKFFFPNKYKVSSYFRSYLIFIQCWLLLWLHNRVPKSFSNGSGYYNSIIRFDSFKNFYRHSHEGWESSAFSDFLDFRFHGNDVKFSFLSASFMINACVCDIRKKRA